MIYTIGESLLDIIFKNEQPVASKAGGSMLNTSISLGRLGLPVSFISEFANDLIGNYIHRFLQENGINTDNIYRFKDGKSALAMAFLDNNNNASYDFYKIYPAKRLDIIFPEIEPGDIVMFGSFYGIDPEIRVKIRDFLIKARENGAIIYYDPNFRKSHLHELEQLLPIINENMQLAHIVRCSDEDMQNITGAKTATDAYSYVNQYCEYFIYTQSSKGVQLFTPLINTELPVRKITPVSTIGAGDTFNAGIAYGLYIHKINQKNLYTIEKLLWLDMLKYAINFASEVCLTYDNYLPREYAAFLIKGK